MKEKMLQWLCCPHCGGELALKAVETREAGEIKSGLLACPQAHTYPIHNFIPRFVTTDGYVKNFSFEWKIFRQAQLDSVTGTHDTETLFKLMTRLSGPEMDTKLVLDVGCGPGKFVEVATQAGAEVVGLDLSFAVDAAMSNFGPRPNIHLVQADIFHLPFRPGLFDIIFSLGVLHHTANCEQAFKKLPGLLKPGGRIAIWVYDRNVFPHFNRRLRSITRRLPSQLLYYLCWLAVPFTYIYNIPVVRAPFYGLRSYFQFISWGTWRQRWLDTFDWYSCWYQSDHTYPEVYQWFTDMGLDQIRLGDIAVSVSGTRTAT